ncbi:T9SS type A sorting domain-containing protein [Winogradskyella alexanderae]|uniref:T9SS type A sorting domain-containing protein n=1 Tax=Winogradskyella alexanderae TaxID=2877123 RepID=A0ABS7XQY0_9FLAO|nr:T9SS type A sorting domain-containing protein [Winogradskyella alexanderae]MCA0132424.1 T9SS type A sorting domain-containing protein [Winogradskyella alexanderae]
MKQKLHFIFFISPFLVFTQSPINQFVNNIETEYAIVSSSIPLDESATGSDLVWNFTTLSQIGTNTDTNAAPTPVELSFYPNTTEVLTITTDGMPPIDSKIFIRNNSGEISLTGAEQGSDLTLTFSNNATLGTFPLSFSFSNSDATSGEFTGNANGSNVAGTFSGVFDTDVDAFGTLNLNDFGLGAYSGGVTRLKTDLSISLVVAGIFNIGTVDQTNYYYYDNTNGSLVFRTSTNIIDIDFLGNVVNETVILYEALDQSVLGIDEFNVDKNTIRLYPNPTSEILHFELDNSTELEKITIFKLNGQQIDFKPNRLNTIDVSVLESGLYFVQFYTKSKIYTKKFFKK